MYQATLNNNGYAKLSFWHRGKVVQVYAHRFFWVLRECRNIPEGYEIGHDTTVCQSRQCVKHTLLQSAEENKKWRKSHPGGKNYGNWRKRKHEEKDSPAT